MKINSDYADHAIGFINNLPHVKGRWSGQMFNLREWQEAPLREVFGRVDSDGLRQIRTLYIEIPRKNGKSELAAGISDLLLYADEESGARIYGAAGDKEQASLVFNVAAQMVRMTPMLQRRSQILKATKTIIDFHGTVGSHDETIPPGTYKAVSSETKTKHGYDASGIIFDELHVQPNRDLWDVLTTSTGTREQPLTVAITTAGFDRNSICWEIHDYALKVLNGIVEDPTFYPVIYAAPSDADWKDEKVWFDCNPALDDFRSLEEMRSMCRQAQERPELENTFRRLYLNQWTRSEVRAWPMEKWDGCNGTVDIEHLLGRRCYGGLDLATTTDVAAYVLAFPMDGGRYLLLCRFWIPDDNMHERIRRDHVPYDVWKRNGLITATPGNVIDYDSILRQIKDDMGMFDLQEIAYDRWGATKLSQDIQKLTKNEDFLVPFGQGYASMSGPTKDVIGLVLSEKLMHGGHPVLRWMSDNLVIVTDDAGNFKPSKKASTEKIDGMVAAIMALDRAMRHREPQKSIYEERGLDTA